MKNIITKKEPGPAAKSGGQVLLRQLGEMTGRRQWFGRTRLGSQFANGKGFRRVWQYLWKPVPNRRSAPTCESHC